MTSSVPQKDVGPLTQVILRLVKVAAVVQAAGPVHSLPVEVLLVIRGLLLTVINRGRRDGRACILLLQHVVSVFVALTLHFLEFVKPIETFGDKRYKLIIT